MADLVIDVGAVDHLGRRVSSRATGLDIGAPAATGGAGSAAVATTWNAVLEKTTWSVYERVIPALALWGSCIEESARWCTERDNALADAFTSSSDTARPGQSPATRIPDFRPTRSTLTSSTSRRFVAGGPGQLWDDTDPGRGEPGTLESNAYWIEDVASALADLHQSLHAETMTLEAQWQGQIGQALVTAGHDLAAMVARLITVVQGACARRCTTRADYGTSNRKLRSPALNWPPLRSPRVRPPTHCARRCPTAAHRPTHQQQPSGADYTLRWMTPRRMNAAHIPP